MLAASASSRAAPMGVRAGVLEAGSGVVVVAVLGSVLAANGAGATTIAALAVPGGVSVATAVCVTAAMAILLTANAA